MRPSFHPSSLAGLLSLVISPLASVYASSPPADNVHFCVPFDYEQWRRDHPRPAAKGLADLNAGEPRTVRIIHFLPNDRPYRAAAVDTIKSVIRQIQTFYAGQMQAHGYGGMTFRFETGGRGEPLVHRLDGQRPDREYTETTVLEEVERAFDLGANLYLIVLDSEPPLRLDGGGVTAGTGDRMGKNSGFGLVPDLVDERISWDIAAHELGHAFGLFHEFGDDAYIMSFGKGKNRLSACSAEFLAVHPYFNPGVPIEEGSSPGVELLSPTAYPADSESVSIRVEVGDAEGVHQVLLASQSGVAVKGCRGGGGSQEAVLEFEYDGAHPLTTWMSLSDPAAHPIFFGTVDRDGNVHEEYYVLSAVSPYQIATLEGHTRIAEAVVFSPDGGTLASGSADGAVKLWDVAARRSTATLTEHSSAVHSVAFSLDGGTLASGSADGTVRLWDVTDRRSTATLTEHSDAVHSVAFSPDGTGLASGSADGVVKLWDVTDRRSTATLTEHSDAVHSVAFSPDGTVLASGSGDGTVKLWDVESGEPIGTLEGHSYSVNSVAFSPDGTILASGSGDNTVKLWDVEARTDVATLSECRNSVESLAFSPDGATLAAASWDQRVVLWDVGTRKWTEAFAQTSRVEAIAFSPDGTTLASGGGDGVVTLWDTSEWAGPLPYGLAMISGDGQQGAPGEALAQPLVVEVRDQYGNPLPDAPVVFTVAEGEGRLSGRFTVERVVTDDLGRAALALTLGPLPGVIAVEVSLGARSDVLTFRAEGIVTDAAGMEGHYRTWHLPEQARVRLGMGSIWGNDRSLAFSPDGRTLAVASGIGVWLYEAASARALALLPSEQVLSVAFSPDGATLASTESKSIRLWDVESREEIATLRRRFGYGLFQLAAFSPDGATLASGSSNGTIRLWDVESREEISTLEGHTDNIESLAFSPDGATLASGADWEDPTIRLWDLESREEIATLEGHTDNIESLAFSPDGATLASAGGFGDPTLRLWDVAARVHVVTLVEGHVHGPYSLSFSPDGATVAAGMSGAIWVWDVAARELIHTIETWSTQSNSSVHAVVFSPDGTTLASASPFSDGVSLWDVGTWSRTSLGEYAGRIESVAFLPDGAVLASSSGGVCRLWDLATGAVTDRLVGAGEVSVSPDGALLALGSLGAVKLWDVGTREEVASLPHGGRVESVSFSPDGAILAWGSEDGAIKLWDVDSREEVASLEGHTTPIRSLAFSPDGSLLASRSGGGLSKLWDVGAREEIASFRNPDPDYSYKVSFSPDGRLLALSSNGDHINTVKLWDVDSREEVASLEYSGWLNHVSFSPDGRLLALSAATVRLWDVETREEIASLEGAGRGPPVAFSPDGAILATGTWDYIRLWDVETRAEIAAFRNNGSWFESMVFSPDGTTLVAPVNGTLVLWDVELLLQPRPRTLATLSGDEQEGPAGAVLAEPFVVEVRDHNGNPFEGARVTFEITSGDGTLSAATVTTDADGRAATTLTLGLGSETVTVTATVAGLDPVTFTATAKTTSDFDGDGETGFSDFFLFADAFGGSDPRFDLDGSGSVDFADFFLLADHFVDPEARGKLLALARERIGLPDGPQLKQNAPNPFNSETVVSFFLLRPGPARVEVFALTGQRVAVLHQGPKKAGVHREHWDGRDDRGRLLASGVYLYRLVTTENVQTRKLTLLR